MSPTTPKLPIAMALARPAKVVSVVLPQPVLIPEINVPKVMPAQAYAQKHIPRGYVITEPVKQE